MKIVRLIPRTNLRVLIIKQNDAVNLNPQSLKVMFTRAI